MSHELRTPLNSLLILAQQLYENAEGNLNDKQIRYAKTIHSCGDDLIQLINDILDLSKIESGFITANIWPVRFGEIAGFVETTFKPISEARHLRFNIETDSPACDHTNGSAAFEPDPEEPVIKFLQVHRKRRSETEDLRGQQELETGQFSLDNAKKWWPSPSAIPVSVSRRKNRISFSKRSSRPKVLPAVSMAVPVLGYPSAVVWPNCLAELLNWKVYHSGSTFTFLSR
jgi:hypothetical protein